jgi:hypothetical protein
MGCPAYAGRPRFDIGDIVREHRGAFEAKHPLSCEQRRVLTDIAQCRTAALGGHRDVCISCDYERVSYNSCRNRHCPKCQALAQEEWIANRREQMLDVGHFHLVFTLPEQLRPLAKFAPCLLYTALFSAAAETLSELAADRLKATLGVTMVLHTWRRDLCFHPHVHAIVTGGGLGYDGKWVACSGKFLFPVLVMGELLRSKVMAKLRRWHADGEFEDFDEFRDPQGFDRLMSRLANKRWNVYAKEPFGKSKHVLEYLGRYTHRVGISNSRLLDVTPDQITFATKGGAVTSVSPIVFLARFVQHVLPDGFHKIRHYGLYAGGAEAKRRAARTLFGQPTPRTPKPRTVVQLLLAVTGRDITRCPRCGGDVVTFGIAPERPHSPSARAPPPPRAA